MAAALARQRLASDYLVFAAVHPAYDRISLVDLAGKERVRVDWSAGVPRIAEDSNLEERVEATYVAETLKLARGQVYQSSFEVTPRGSGGALKPTISFATPFFDRRGERRGVVTIAYLGQPIIDRLRAMNEGHPGRLTVLNGSWQLADRPGPRVGMGRNASRRTGPEPRRGQSRCVASDRVRRCRRPFLSPRQPLHLCPARHGRRERR